VRVLQTLLVGSVPASYWLASFDRTKEPTNDELIWSFELCILLALYKNFKIAFTSIMFNYLLLDVDISIGNNHESTGIFRKGHSVIIVMMPGSPVNIAHMNRQHAVSRNVNINEQPVMKTN
jgi:hypothetical protein